jgi:hypothetical protein
MNYKNIIDKIDIVKKENLNNMNIDDLIKIRNEFYNDKNKLVSCVDNLINVLSDINRILYVKCEHEYYKDYSTYGGEHVCKKCSYTISK